MIARLKTRGCAYWGCPHEPLNGNDRCVFHAAPTQPGKVAAETLPGKLAAATLPDRPGFWRHLANLLLAYAEQSEESEVREYFRQPNAEWLERERDNELLSRYRDATRGERIWRLAGFVFPDLDAEHSFSGFVFDGIDVTGARFTLSSRRLRATAEDAAAHSRRMAMLRPDDMNEPPPTPSAWEEQQRGGSVLAPDPEDVVSFSGARFLGKAVFRGTAFECGADLSQTHFAGTADFSGCTFEKSADFRGAVFMHDAFFAETAFPEQCVCRFDRVVSERRLDFSDARFDCDLDFVGAVFRGRVEFQRTKVNGVLALERCRSREMILFEGTQMGANAVVLLWALDFEGPEAQVVLRDLASGIHRISLLHTDVYSDRPRVWFTNVNWRRRTQPSDFLYDSHFVYHKVCRWPDRWPARVCGKYAPRIAGLYGREQDSVDLPDLVSEDVERIIREIRKAHEQLSGYSDAGDFHVIEMDHRLARTPWRHVTFRLALKMYKVVSSYGESPSRALGCLVVVWALAGFGMMYSGFSFLGPQVQYSLRPNLNLSWTVVKLNLLDFAHSLMYSFVSLIPGYFRFLTQGGSIGTWTAAISIVEGVLGASIIALLLLAVRRRFRR